jgi:hypothetical protein
MSEKWALYSGDELADFGREPIIGTEGEVAAHAVETGAAEYLVRVTGWQSAREPGNPNDKPSTLMFRLKPGYSIRKVTSDE